MSGIKQHPQPYTIINKRLDAIFVWPSLKNSVGVGYFDMKEIQGKVIDGKSIKRYQFYGTDVNYHPKYQNGNLLFGCIYNLTVDTSTWRLSGVWEWSDPLAGRSSSGTICAYKIDKWHSQVDPEQYVGVRALQRVPNISLRTPHQTASFRVNEIVNSVQLKYYKEVQQLCTCIRF